MGVSKNSGKPPKWMFFFHGSNPIQMDDLGGFSHPYFWKPPSLLSSLWICFKGRPVSSAFRSSSNFKPPPTRLQICPPKKKIGNYPPQIVFWGLHPPKQTWNLKMDPWKRRFLLETTISRFHVNLRGCI